MYGLQIYSALISSTRHLPIALHGYACVMLSLGHHTHGPDVVVCFLLLFVEHYVLGVLLEPEGSEVALGLLTVEGDLAGCLLILAQHCFLVVGLILLLVFKLVDCFVLWLVVIFVNFHVTVTTHVGKGVDLVRAWDLLAAVEVHLLDVWETQVDVSFGPR